MTDRPLAGRLTAATEPLLTSFARRTLLAGGRRLAIGSLDVTLPDGTTQRFGTPGATPHAAIEVHDVTAFRRLLLGGATGAGEAYQDGMWSSPDLVRLLELAALNRRALELSSGWMSAPARLRRGVGHRLRRNTRKGSRKNIVAHYDLGNDFYRLFLDETMTYSSAVFATPDQPLADAQRNKYRLMADGAGLEPGMRVLEIGSGWGGFAMYAAGERGCDVTSITVSDAQHALANERIRDAGLADRARVELRDYRDLTGTWDAIVSIEMFEAVGPEYYRTFFDACDRALTPDGRLSLQTISFHESDYRSQLRGVNWIQQYIFPGGVLPSLAAIEEATSDTDLVISGVTDIGPHYVATLRAWRTRFLAQLDAVRAMGFDERFIRTWEYYLALSEAGFATAMTQDLQLVFRKRRGGRVPNAG
ncbi:MAG: cyclopropane-fatty-acyl-phospholipid synthase family protein [Chloroflexota bacterium]